jgi:nucleoside-diphosphate-sugar epimerase
MHVFLAGDTGVLGRRIVPLLVADGHRVTGLTRDTSGADLLRAAGAEAVVADATHAEAMLRAVGEAAPDVLMNQLTDLSGGVGAANSALRFASSATLGAAAQAAGVGRVVAQSIAWAYAAGDVPAQEGELLDHAAADPRGTTVRAVSAVEAAAAGSPEWVVLRYGLLYGPDTWYAADGATADQARAGALVPDADVTSFVHVDDAARAAVAALEWPSGAVNVCDDEPAAASDWVPAFCTAVGAPVPEVGRGPARHDWARGADNTWLRSGLSFRLEHPIWRPGFSVDGLLIDHDS